MNKSSSFKFLKFAQVFRIKSSAIETYWYAVHCQLAVNTNYKVNFFPANKNLPKCANSSTNFPVQILVSIVNIVSKAFLLLKNLAVVNELKITIETSALKRASTFFLHILHLLAWLTPHRLAFPPQPTITYFARQKSQPI